MLGQDLGVAVNGGTGGKDDLINARIPGGQQNFERPFHVDAVALQRIFNRLLDRGQGGLVIDVGGTLKGRLELLQLTNILPMDLALIGILLEELGQILTASGGKIVDHANATTLL